MRAAAEVGGTGRGDRARTGDAKEDKDRDDDPRLEDDDDVERW